MLLRASPLLLLSARPNAPAPRAPPASASAIEIGDVIFVATALGLAGAAGYLQYSLSAGDKGLNAFLMKEKSENPFYKEDFKSDARPELPKWIANLRLPELDFVEVYGQESSPRGPAGPSWTKDSGGDKIAVLYRRLDAAVEREDYDEASRCKSEIDALLGSEDGR